ncbi:hypothetical protein D3C72_1785410 [compost metagenome]
MGGVFDDPQAVAARDVQDGGHVAGQAAVMNGNDGLGARSDGAFNGLGAEAESVRVDIHQHGFGAQIAGHFGAGGKGVGGGDDFVALAHADGFQRQVQAGGGRVHCDRFYAAADETGEFLLEGAGVGARREPAGPHGFSDSRDFGFADVR